MRCTIGKDNNVADAPSEDSDQPRHPPSLIRVMAVCAHWILKDLCFLHADSDDCNQPKLANPL